MRKWVGMWTCLLSFAMLLSVFSVTAQAFDVSGFVGYSTSSKRVYLSIQTQNGRFGTSIPSTPGAYTIQGVPAGTNYVVQAFVDSLATGSRHVSDPYGSSASFNVTTAAVPDINISSFQTSVPATIPTPTGLTVLPADSSALIMWNSNNSDTGETADSYELYWSTSPNAAVSGTMISIPATGDMRGFILRAPTAFLNNGTQYYFAVKAKIGAVTSAASTDTVATIGSFGSYTVSGLVTFPTGIVPTDVPMMVGVVKANSNGPPTEFYAGMVTTTPVTSPATYTVLGVPNGSYRVYAMFDVNKNGLMDIGDLNTSDANAPLVEVLNSNVTSGADITITSDNAEARVNVNHWSNGTQNGFVLNYDIEGKIKRPVTVTLTSGTNISGPLDIAMDNSGRFSNWTDLAANRPNPGDSYTFNVFYSDNTSGSVTGAVSAVLDSFATPTAPVGLGVTYAPIPSFTWIAPSTGAPANFTYNIELKQDGGGANWYSNSISNSLLTTPYNFDGRANQATLTDGATYTWGIGVSDLMGNTASYYTNFTFTGGASGPWTVYNANPTNKNDIDWLQSAHSLLPPGSYIRINGIYYYTSTAGGISYWNNSSIYWGNGFYSCDQSTGAVLYDTAVPPMPVRPDLSGTTGMTIEYFATWASTGNSSGPLSITTTSLSNAVAGYSYSQQIYANGGTSPYTFSIATGTLPVGVTFSSAGVISGTPSAAGSYSFTARVTGADAATATQLLNFTVDTASATISSAGVYHNNSLSGGEVDLLDMVVKNVTALSPTTSVTATVSGPNGFIYSFTNADIKPFINGQIDLNYQLPTALISGVYTFTLDDGQGHVSKRVDTHGGIAAVPVVDSTKIQFQRKSDGSYRITWPPVNDTKTYNYRVRIQTNDGTGTPVYLSGRSMLGYDDVPAANLVTGTMYQLRIEATESSTFDMVTNRSSSAYVTFTPQVTDNAGMLLYSYVGAFNQTEAVGTQGAAFGFAVCNATGASCSSADANLVTLAEIYAPDGSLYYTFNLTADKQANGIDFYHFFNPAPATGTYKFHFVANGLDHYDYATLTAPVIYPVPDSTTYQAQEQSNGTIRFSWANVNHNGALYYRVQAKDTVTGLFLTTGRVNQAYVDVLKTTLANTFGSSTNVQWRVEVYDSSNYNTQRNRFNGTWSTTVLSNTPPYSASLPVIGNYGIANTVQSNGSNSSELWFTASSSVTITELRIEGPGGYVRNMLTQGAKESSGQYRLMEPGVLLPGQYKFTAFDSNGNNTYRFDYLTAPHALPVVDFKSMQVNTEPNGDIRFSWAPIVSDIPAWCSLFVYANTDINGTGFPDLLTSTTLAQTSSAVLSATTLAQSQLMLRVHCSDGSNATVFNNRSRSVMVGYHGAGYNYAALTDIDGDGYASDIDANDNSATIYPLAPTATGDTQSPSIPAGLNGSALNSNQINLNWSASSDNVAVSYYKVFRNGSPVGQPSGATNTFWQDNSLAPNTTYNYTVAACDAVPNCSAQSSPFSVTTQPSVITGPVNITGTISYTGTQTGRVYLSIQTNNGTLGTSVPWPSGTTTAPYTIRGVPSNNLNNNVSAFMDIAGNGVRSASSPFGSSTGTTAVKDITLTESAAAAPLAPSLVEVKPGPASVFIMWQPNNDANGVVDADSYDVYWSNSASVSSTNFTGSILDVPVGMDSPLVVNGLTDGSVLYFQVIAKRGIYSAPSTATGPITVGATTGLNTVSGTVTYTGAIPADTPLYVAVVAPNSNKGMGNLYFTSIASASASQTFTVSGIPDGSYNVYTILDLNKDGMFAGGDATNTNGDQAPIITLSGNAGMTGINVPLISKNAEVVINTDNGKNVAGTSSWYNVEGRVSGQFKRPVTVTLTDKPASSTLTVPMDLGVSNNNYNEFQFWNGNTTAPVVGDTYTFLITYSDGTSETLTSAVTGVSNSFPINPYVGTPTTTIPKFDWSVPTVAPTGSYQYSLSVQNTNHNNMWEAWSIPSSQLQIVYGSGSNSSATLLQTGITYNWYISTRDQNGNRATVEGSFTPTSVASSDAIAPTIVSTSPANGATGITTNTQIIVTFSEPITGMPAQATALKNNATGQYVAGLWSGSGTTMIFTPSALLAPGTTYSVQLSTVTDLAGNALPPTTLTFTTAAEVVSYTVTFSSNGGSAVTSQSVVSNATATAPTAPTKAGNSFAGWYTDAGLTSAFTFTTPITANTMLYAKWTTNTYAVSFDSNGGSTISNQTISYNGTATTPTAPTKVGSTFSGWYSDSGLTSVFAFSTAITVDTTLYAKWTTNTYTVSFNSNGGNPISNQTVLYNGNATAPTYLTRTGFTFAGWYSDSGLTSAFAFSTAITTDTTLYAKWTLSVTFNSNGGSAVDSHNIVPGSIVTIPVAPIRTGYTFDKWYIDPTLTSAFIYTTPITTNFTLYAKWVANDVILPTILSASPAINATNVSVNSVLTVKFSETIDQNTLPVETAFLKTAAGVYVPGVGSYDSATNTGIFTPNAPLAFNTTYTGTLSGIKDLAGNTMASGYTLTFTTGSQPDTVIPTVTQAKPQSNATNVSVDVIPTITFSEPVKPATLQGAIILRVGTAQIPGSVAYDAATNTATFTPSTPLDLATTYTLSIGNTIEDLAGNKLNPITIFFKTGFPSGDIDGANGVDIADAYKMLEIAVGRVTATPQDLKRADIAPLVNGQPKPDGKIDVADVVVILRRIVGLVSW